MKVQDEKSSLFLRMPMALKQWLQNQASQNHRTLAGEVTLRLERTKHQDETREREEGCA